MRDAQLPSRPREAATSEKGRSPDPRTGCDARGAITFTPWAPPTFRSDGPETHRQQGARRKKGDDPRAKQGEATFERGQWQIRLEPTPGAKSSSSSLLLLSFSP
eukprot:4492106-Pyramimonas_sp.AAC.2